MGGQRAITSVSGGELMAKGAAHEQELSVLAPQPSSKQGNPRTLVTGTSEYHLLVRRHTPLKVRHNRDSPIKTLETGIRNIFIISMAWSASQNRIVACKALRVHMCLIKHMTDLSSRMVT